MSADEEVRLATSDDVEHLVRLLTETIESTPHTRAGHLSGFPQRHIAPRTRILDALQIESQTAFVALLEGNTVGYALVVVVDDMPGGLLARVEELYVEPPAREVGLGELLLDACVQWASAKGCSGIDVEAQPGARSAKNLAERSGFTARSIILHRKLL